MILRSESTGGGLEYLSLEQFRQQTLAVEMTREAYKLR